MQVTEALDAWSLGVLAIELLTGATPLNLQEGADAVRPPHSLLYTRKGSDRGNPQSTIMHRVQNTYTHSNGTTSPLHTP